MEEGNPVFFKIKDFWIPAFAGMTTIVILSIFLQMALITIYYVLNCFLDIFNKVLDVPIFRDKFYNRAPYNYPVSKCCHI